MRIFPTIFSLMLLCSQAFAIALHSGGGMATGGGSGVVCRDENFAVTSVQLLDLFEAQAQNHLTLVSSSGDSRTDYQNAVKRTYEVQKYDVNSPTEQEIQTHYSLFFKSVHWTSPGAKLPLITDQGSIFPLPSGCALEQIAIFHDGDSEFIELQTDLWQRLPALHQAALLVHELIYKTYRLLGDYNSEFTRIYVAQNFSQERKSILEGISADAELCTAYSGSTNETTKFVIYPVPSPTEGLQWVLQFTQLMGRPLESKTWIVLHTSLPRLSPIYSSIGTSVFPVISSDEAPMAEFFRLQGLGYENWNIKVTWSPEKPVSIGLYGDHRLQQESYLWDCTKEKP